jgi:membrane-associated phospholipid phosphatase
VLRVVPAREFKIVSTPFEPRALWTYRIIVAELAATAILLPILGFTLSPEAAVALPLWAFLLAVAAMLLRRYGHQRTSGAMEAVALIYGQGFATLFLLFPLTAISLPFADNILASFDHVFGFDWLSFAALFAGRPLAQTALVIAYHSFDWQPLIIVLALFAKDRQNRAWQFVTAGTIAALLTSVLYPVAPALGAYWHFGLNAAEFPNLHAGWQFGPIIEAVRNGAREIGPDKFTGMVSFPSYHASAAVIFAWAMWPLKVARGPFAILNFLVCVSALLVGAHYLVDVIGGVMVGAVSIIGSRLL